MLYLNKHINVVKCSGWDRFYIDFFCYLGSGQANHLYLQVCVLALTESMFFLQGPAQAQNLRDSLAEAKSDIVVKVSSSHVFTSFHTWVRVSYMIPRVK